MTVAEHQLLGNIFLMTLISFFGIALPGYLLIRAVWPDNDWNLGGSVSTSALQPFDLIVAAGYITIFILNWKQLIKTVANDSLSIPTAGTVLFSSFTLLLIAGLIPFMLHRRISLMEFFGLRWLGWTRLFWIVPSFVIGLISLEVIMFKLGWQGWVQDHFGGGSQRTVELLNTSPNLALLGAIAFSAIVMAPIAEEVIFRGYLYPVVKRYTDRWFATLFTAMLFGVIHFNIMSLPLLAIMGIILVILYEITGSLWVTIACHAGFNATSIGLTLLGRLQESPAS